MSDLADLIGARGRLVALREQLASCETALVDNELRPEGVALTYNGANGVFGSAYHYWLEERPASTDSTRPRS